MILYNYNDFLFEADEKEKKKISFYISEVLRGILSNIDSPISKKIIELDASKQPTVKGHNKFEISYLDCDRSKKDKDDKISFMPAAKASEVPGYSDDIPIPCGDCYNSKLRQEMSVGKVVNKLFPDTFKQQEIEKFVNDFKAEIGKIFADFKLVDGEDIRKYYLVDNYENINQGDINSSCMRYDYAQKYLDIYVKNTDKCKLLILMSDKNKDKIKGRALVWMGLRKPTGRVYMDRIYTINQSDQKLYINYAIENNWFYKSQQVMHDASYIDNGKRVYSSVAVQLNPAMYDYYPSMDTLPYYTPSTGRLGSNPGNYIKGHPRLHLNSAEGGAQKLDRDG
jgi:hypothetical protein